MRSWAVRVAAAQMVAGAAVYARTAGEEALAMTAGAAVFARTAG